MNAKNIIKTTQEQAIASWINYLNQIRLNELTDTLKHQKTNFNEAIKELNLAEIEIDKVIDINRGGKSGIHGFVAEIAEKGIHNAERLVKGLSANMQWVDDNGMTDLLRDNTAIQQKFYQSDGLFSLNAAAKHLKAYPDFLKNGSKYQIPKDQYEKVIYLHQLDEKEAYKLLNSNTSPTISQWRRVNEFFKHSEIKINDLEPSYVKYKEVQIDAIHDTLKKEKDSLKETDSKIKDEAYQKSKPSFHEGTKATLASAVIEGGTTLSIKIYEKIKSGKKLKEFTEDDWKDILNESGISFTKGGIRGASIYTLSNFTATPAFIASSIVTASFGIADLINMYRNNQITEIELIENSEILCLDASVSAVSSLLGQVLIPVPVLGSVIGNTLGTMMYQIAKDNFDKKEQEFYINYQKQQKELDKHISDDLQQHMNILNKNTKAYINLLNNAFVFDIEVSFHGSIQLAKTLGVPFNEILDTKDKIDSFFLD